MSALPATIPHSKSVAVGGIASMTRLLAVGCVLFLATTTAAPRGEEAHGIASGGQYGGHTLSPGAGPHSRVEGAGAVKLHSHAVVSSMTLEDDEMSDEPLILNLPPELQVSLVST